MLGLIVVLSVVLLPSSNKVLGSNPQLGVLYFLPLHAWVPSGYSSFPSKKITVILCAFVLVENMLNCD